VADRLLPEVSGDMRECAGLRPDVEM